MPEQFQSPKDVPIDVLRSLKEATHDATAIGISRELIHRMIDELIDVHDDRNASAALPPGTEEFIPKTDQRRRTEW